MATEALTHPDDATLLELLDGESDAADAAQAAHVAACAACHERMGRHRLRRERLAAMLAAADFPIPAATRPEPGVIPLRARRPAPRRWGDAGWLRAAAAVLLLVAAAAVATPARAWIVGWLGERWAVIAHREPPR
ncbi:MAG: hypothetical protein ACJ8J0_11770, partial [Longimicrobiaceae bacterium]